VNELFSGFVKKFENKLHDLMVLYLDYSIEDQQFSLIYVYSLALASTLGLA